MRIKFWSGNLKERALGRPKCRWKGNNIRMDWKIGWKFVDWELLD